MALLFPFALPSALPLPLPLSLLSPLKAFAFGLFFLIGQSCWTLANLALAWFFQLAFASGFAEAFGAMF